MKQFTILSFLLCVCCYAYTQADGSLYPLQLGKKTAIFKYDEKNKTLFLQDDADKSINIKYPWARDTVTQIDPQSGKEETKVITSTSAGYHIETEMSYSDFLVLLKSKFILKNPQKNLKVYSYNIYYQSPDTGGFIKVQYPGTAEGVISKLNCLVKGGFILLSLRAADHDEAPIDAQGRFLTLIHIKN
jgi:hypothetical protein